MTSFIHHMDIITLFIKLFCFYINWKLYINKSFFHILFFIPILSSISKITSNWNKKQDMKKTIINIITLVYQKSYEVFKVGWIEKIHVIYIL